MKGPYLCSAPFAACLKNRGIPPDGSACALCNDEIPVIDPVDMTREKGRISAELNIATQIRADILPSIFPIFSDRHDMNLYAYMHPAKDVGGDFYDFFLADDTHLAIITADVSGKGVPAALFMAIARIRIKNQAMSGDSPSMVPAKVNEQLPEKTRPCCSSRYGWPLSAFFGTDRLAEALNRDPGADPEKQIAAMRDTIRRPNGGGKGLRSGPAATAGHVPSGENPNLKESNYESEASDGTRLVLPLR